jgi:hypothetical protein
MHDTYIIIQILQATIEKITNKKFPPFSFVILGLFKTNIFTLQFLLTLIFLRSLRKHCNIKNKKSSHQFELLECITFDKVDREKMLECMREGGISEWYGRLRRYT